MKDIIINSLAAGIHTVGGSTAGNSLETDIQAIISNIILVLGIVAVIIIVVGGISYMTSNGDTGKVKKAKDTILYGVIGLIICALSYAIVNWVIMSALKGTSAQPSESSAQQAVPTTGDNESGQSEKSN